MAARQENSATGLYLLREPPPRASSLIFQQSVYSVIREDVGLKGKVSTRRRLHSRLLTYLAAWLADTDLPVPPLGI